MSLHELDDAMRWYLGGTPDEPGVYPIGMADRLAARFQNTHTVIRRQLDEILAAVPEFPGDQYKSLAEMADAIALWLASEMPEFAEITRRKIANYITFSWR